MIFDYIAPAVLLFPIVWLLICWYLLEIANKYPSEKPIKYYSTIGLRVQITNHYDPSSNGELEEFFDNILIPFDLTKLNMKNTIKLINDDERFRIPFQNFIKKVKSMDILL